MFGAAYQPQWVGVLLVHLYCLPQAIFFLLISIVLVSYCHGYFSCAFQPEKSCCLMKFCNCNRDSLFTWESARFLSHPPASFPPPHLPGLRTVTILHWHWQHCLPRTLANSQQGRPLQLVGPTLLASGLHVLCITGEALRFPSAAISRYLGRVRASYKSLEWICLCAFQAQIVGFKIRDLSCQGYLHQDRFLWLVKAFSYLPYFYFLKQINP